MKEKRKKEINEMANSIDDVRQYPMTKEESFQGSSVGPDIKKRLLKADEIIATKKLEIPKCQVKPMNGRMFIKEVSGYELKSPGGLILPQKMMPKKNDDMEDIKRYFLVDWDHEEIPDHIQRFFEVGLEVNPFLNEAENFVFPKVVDWQGNNVFIVMHYTELAGVSRVRPEQAE